VLDAGDGSPLEPGRVAQTFALSRWLAGRPHVSRVDSFVDLDRSLDLATYQQIAALPRAARPPQLEAALRLPGGRAHRDPDRPDRSARGRRGGARARAEIRTGHPPYAGEVLVTGQTAFDLDFIGLVLRRAPLAIGLVVVVTALVLFLLLDSVVLPVKAIVMNLLSITASTARWC